LCSTTATSRSRHLLDHRLARPTRAETLAKDFDLPASTFANFPKKEVYIAKGPVPPSTRGTMRIVSMREFPISTTMTGSLLAIKPGSLRELHGHPNAAEWQYYLKSNACMTVFGSHGRARTDDFIAGDVGYVPQGYGHYIENTGSDDVEMVIVFDNVSWPGWRPTPAFCLRPISARRRAHSRNFPRAR
jgi:oxalate decarboxylase